MGHRVMVLGSFGLAQAEADAEVVSRVLSALCGQAVPAGDLVEDAGVFVRRWRCVTETGTVEVQLVSDETVDTSFVVVGSADAGAPSAFPDRVTAELRAALRAPEPDRLLRAAREDWRTEPETLMRAALDSATSWEALGPTLLEACATDDERTWNLCLQAMAMAPRGVVQRLLARACEVAREPSRLAAAQRLRDMYGGHG